MAFSSGFACGKKWYLFVWTKILFFWSCWTPSIRASEKNVDQYQDLSAPGCTLNWLVKNPGNEPEFSKIAIIWPVSASYLGVGKSTSEGNLSFHLLHCKYASPYVCWFSETCFIYFYLGCFMFGFKVVTLKEIPIGKRSPISKFYYSIPSCQRKSNKFSGDIISSTRENKRTSSLLYH